MFKEKGSPINLDDTHAKMRDKMKKPKVPNLNFTKLSILGNTKLDLEND